jgi:predicted nucleotidyltransferase
MTRDEAIARLKQSESVLKEAGVTHLYLFGSTVRGEARPDSDVDLFFDYEREDFGLFQLMDVKELAADILGTKTDMIPREGLHHMLRQRIEASALQVF